MDPDPLVDGTARFFAAFTDRVVRWRWPLLALIALATVFFARQLPNLQLDNSNEQWLVEGDRTLEQMEKFKHLFGNDDFVFVLYDAGEFFRAEPIRRLGALADALEERVPHLLDMTWLGNAEYIEGRAESVDVEDLMAELPETPAALAQVRSRALAEPSYLDNLISRDGRTAGVVLEMDVYPDDHVDPRKDVAPAVRAILAEPEHADLPLVAVGGPLLDYDLDVIAAREAQRLGLYCLGVQVLILFWVGRGLRGVIVPLTVVVLGVVWTFGVIAVAGYKLNFSIIMVPVLLICVGIGDSMHLIAELNDQRRRGFGPRDAVRRAMSLVGWPCVLTSVTTSLGFLSFLAAGLKPFREMGIYAAIGVALALALSLAVVPVLYSWGGAGAKPGRAGAPVRGDVFDRLLRGVARLVAARPRTLAAVFAGLLVASFAGVSRIVVETNPVQMFDEGVPAREAFEYVDANMGGSMSVELMLDSGRPDGVLEPDFLRRMDAFERAVGEHELATKTTSVLDIFRQMRRAFNENRPEYYDVPATRAEASQYLLVYEMSGGEERQKLVPSTNDVARLTVRTRALGTRDVGRLMGDIREQAARHLGDAATVEFTGMMSWASSMAELVATGQRQSFTAAFASITLLMMLVLRSLRLGVISMIPNVFPVLVTLGFLGLVGEPLDMMMMGFSAIIIGVAVDDTIHFFVRYRREFERLGRYELALEATLTSVGRPILFTTLTLTLGFAVLGASVMKGLYSFGVLSGFAFAWALLADFLFAPALLLLLRPLGPERVD